MKYFTLLFFPFLLMSDIHHESKEKNAFFYVNAGGRSTRYGDNVYSSIGVDHGIDIGVGYRTIHGISAFDINAGITSFYISREVASRYKWIPSRPLAFVQAAYLLYPFQSNGPYLGLGIECSEELDVYSSTHTIVTSGCHVKLGANPIFIQFQCRPLVAPGYGASLGESNLSLGVGF